jgi:sigma-B regulation protein RsbU (phosphoserine phosphatase)
MKILIVDDDLLMRQFLASILEGQGHEVIHAEDGLDAWEKFQAEPTRLVITDWKMPRMDGIDLCRKIREDAERSYAYVIIVTSNNERDDVSEGLSAGADDFVTKPFDPTELRWRVNSGLRVLRLEDALEDRIIEVRRTAAKLEQANAQIREELEAAADIQRALVPEDTGQSDCIHFACRFQASDFLGGDGMNVFAIDEHHVVVYVADVCGHGIKPALLAVAIHRVLTPVAGQNSIVADVLPDGTVSRIASPTEVLERLNQQFPMDLKTCQYFTMLYGILNTSTGEFQYSSAGHPTPICIRKGGTAEMLPGGGLPVGMVEYGDFEAESVTLKAGDRICLYTDGITEAKNSDGAMFEPERLADTLARTHGRTPCDSLKAVVTRVDKWSSQSKHDDDCSLILLELLGLRSDAGSVFDLDFDESFNATDATMTM